ncbi:type I restriction enzyme, S subunit [Pseudomonas saponiphila]|uniref:Type I restriction enzyme, S subunit n=1 Tax=Pseudomonas saponiphila TaxID=556534 RepID=A0A1H4WQY3_9PSED|nr:restriction endonuclease subunit S [Pseudomonas saponiphila]SEC95716.1 type I restriction enzyme, S subunit [Pseudomonas saponiphila]
MNNSHAVSSYLKGFSGKTIPLDDLCTSITDCPHSTPKWADEGVVVLRSSNIKGGELDLSSPSFTDHISFKERVKRAAPESGDIVITREAPMGEVCLIPAGLECCLGQRMVLLKVNQKKISSQYLLFALQSEFVQKQIRKSDRTGSTVSNLCLPDLRALEIPILENTSNVAAALKAITDKIKTNNRINSELEAVAKTLYDYWFVQFDFPDTNGKPYKTSGGKMAYNQTLKREIPEGWGATPLSKITPVSSQSVSPADYPDKVFRHFSIPVYDATNNFGLEAGKTIGSNKFTVKDSDVLVSKLNPWFSRVIYAMEEADLICSTEFVVWRTPSNNIKNFLYMVATSPQFIAHCTQSATGTSNSHKRVTPGVMMRFQVPFNLEVAKALGEKLDSMIKAIIINQRENAGLARLRDWLLPMLMNGQIKVA